MTKPETQTQAEVDSLRKQLDLMGIKYHVNTGVAKLRELVRNALADTQEVIEEDEQIKSTSSKPSRKEVSSLVRVVVSCLNPMKRELTGEIFTVSNSLGTFKKYVPFNNDNGWHIPKAIYDNIKERKFQTFVVSRALNGIEVRTGKYVPEYNVVDLPPLTQDELKELARQQTITRATEE